MTDPRLLAAEAVYFATCEGSKSDPRKMLAAVLAPAWAEVERLRKDAERLDWMIANRTYVGGTAAGLFAMRNGSGMVYGNNYSTPRQAIDAAIDQQLAGGSAEVANG